MPNISRNPGVPRGQKAKALYTEGGGSLHARYFFTYIFNNMLQSIINFFFPPKAVSEINPVDYGWTETSELFYHKGEFILKYTSYDKWVFDKTKKDRPGTIAKFDPPLLEEDVLYANAHIKRVTDVSNR